MLEFVFKGAVFEGGAVEEVASVFARADDAFEWGGGGRGDGVLGCIGGPEVGVATVWEEGLGWDGSIGGMFGVRVGKRLIGGGF